MERALQEQARQDMRAGEQVIAYPGEASTTQPCLQDCFDNWDAEKIASSVAEAALGRQASGSWAWLSSATAQSSAERSLVTRDSGVWAPMSSDTAEEASLEGGSVKASLGGLLKRRKRCIKRSSAGTVRVESTCDCD